jgi:pyrroloquinoline quinone (PQQ) biosynthesis protein C
VGISREEIENFPTLEAVTSTFDWLWSKARDPDWLVGFTAVNGLEILGDRNLPSKYRLKAGTGLDPDPYFKHLGLSQDATQFFEVSDKADAGHGHETVRIIADYTPEHRQNEILQILDESMQRLRFMTDSMWTLSKELEDG